MRNQSRGSNSENRWSKIEMVISSKYTERLDATDGAIKGNTTIKANTIIKVSITMEECFKSTFII